MGQLRGTIGHAAVAEFYRLYDQPLKVRGKAAIKVVHDTIDNIKIDTGIDLAYEFEFIAKIIIRYCLWADKHDDFVPVSLTGEGLALEQKFEMKFGPTIINGIWDGIVKDSNDRYWILEHKFLERVSTKHLELDAQVNMYMLVAAASGYEPEGVIYNMVRMKEEGIAEKEPVARIRVYRNFEGLQAISTETMAQIEEMLAFHTLGGKIYRNATRDCSWDCGYFNACAAINDSGSPESVLKSMPIKPFEGEMDGKDYTG